MKTKLQYAKDWDSLMQYHLIEEDDEWLDETQYKDIVRSRDDKHRITNKFLQKVIDADRNRFEQQQIQEKEAENQLEQLKKQAKENKQKIEIGSRFGIKYLITKKGQLTARIARFIKITNKRTLYRTFIESRWWKKK